MLGEWFYNERIRKAVAVFGSLFNNIFVVRHDSAGKVISQIKVPLSYAPQRDFLARIGSTESGEIQERQIAVKLPRMSFEILAMQYDATRQLPKINKRVVPNETGAENAKLLYTPVPFNIQFQLSVYARSQDDALQIVEQILPFFTPQYNVSVKPLEGFDLIEDTPIRLDGLTMQDDYEGAIENRRTIIYTLDFEMKLNLYRKVNSATSMITSVESSVFDMDGNLLTFIQCDANVVSGDTGTGTEDDASVTNTLVLKNTLNPIVGYDVTTQPANGSATVDETGKWTYVPRGDFFGTDTFVIGVDVGQNVIESVTITVTLESVDGDAVDDAFTVFQNITTILDVATNDDFENTGSKTYSVETFPTNGGLLTINNSPLGLFNYTANNLGVDTWQYRATPDNIPTGSGEVALVTVTANSELTYTVSVPNTIEGATVQATITTNYANNQTVNWSITGDNNTNGRISTTSGSVTMDALSKTVDIVVGQPAGEQGTVTSTFTISDAGTDHDAPYTNAFATAVTASDTFDILDTYPSETATSDTPVPNGYYGYSVDADGELVVIGEPASNKVYVKNLVSSTTVVISGTANDFGRTVATDGNLVAVTGGVSGDAASVYLYAPNGDLLHTYTNPNDLAGSANDQFGYQLSFTEDFLVISAILDGGSQEGSVYFFDKNSPYTTYYRFDYAVGANNRIGSVLSRNLSGTNQIILNNSEIGNRPFFGFMDPNTGNFVHTSGYVGANDANGSGGSNSWNSHFGKGLSSAVVTPNHIILGYPVEGVQGNDPTAHSENARISVWKWADPPRGNFGLFGATPSTPKLSGTFTVRDTSGFGLSTRIDVTSNQLDSILPSTYRDTAWAYIRNVDLDQYIICAVRRDGANNRIIIGLSYSESTGFEGGAANIPGYSTPFPGTQQMNLEISLCLAFDHHIFANDIAQGDGSQTLERFGSNIAINSTYDTLYVSANNESFDGTENANGAVYKFSWNDNDASLYDHTTMNQVTSNKAATLLSYFPGLANETLTRANSSNFWGTPDQQLLTNGAGLARALVVSEATDQVVIGASAAEVDGQQYAGKVYIGPTFTSV